VFEEHVRRLARRPDDLLTARVLRVERQAPIVAVEGEEEETVGVRSVLEDVPRNVALGRFLDIDTSAPIQSSIWPHGGPA